MLTTKEQLHDAIWKRWQILIFAKECHQYAWYFWGDTDKTSDEIEYVGRSKHIQFIRECLFQRYIIELAKLISSNTRNNHYTLEEFFLLVRTHAIPDCGLGEADVALWESGLRSHEPVISTIRTLRNRLYAHTDADFSGHAFSADLSFLKLRELLEYIEEIIRTVYSRALESHIMVGTPYFSSNKIDILRVLAKDWRDRTSGL